MNKMDMVVGYGWKRTTTGGVVGYPIGRFGYPVVPLRLYFGAAFCLPFFTFLAVMAHLRFNWFTSYRQLYFLAGTLAGVLGGYAEAFLVTKKLKTDIEVVAWFLIPLGLAVWVVPIAFVYLFLSADEFLPFATYFLLPSAAIAGITSGYKFHSFEKKEKVRVFNFFLTGYLPYPKYWIETPETLEIELYGFLEAVTEGDSSWMLYYGKYAQQLKKLIGKFCEKSDKLGRKFSEIEELVSELLDRIIEFNQKQRRISLVFVASMAAWMAFIFFAAAYNYLETLQTYGRHVALGVVGVPLLLIFVYPFIKRKNLTKNYKRTVKARLDKINVKSKDRIKDVMELLTTRKSLR